MRTGRRAFGATSSLILALACGGQTEPGDANTGGAGSGGTGGTSTGGTSSGGGVAIGGNSGAGTGGGSGGVVGGSGGTTSQCGESLCPSYKLGGLIDTNACCGPNKRCGAFFKSPANEIIGGIPEGCYESNQVGNLDCGCPAFTYNDPLLPGTTATFPGCCTSLGSCGYVIDLVGMQGPNMGCQRANWGAGQGKSCVPGSGSPCNVGGSDAGPN